MKKLVLHSGGMDSLACMLDTISKFGSNNIISLGFNYGQRHFHEETEAANKFCQKHNIPRRILKVDLSQIGGCPLTDHKMEVTTDMDKQRSTVVPQRNAILCLFAAAFAQENDCDMIVHGACAEDFAAYRDCRGDFFRLLEATIQAGRTDPIRGSEDVCSDFNHDFSTGWIIPSGKIDVRIWTPLLHEKKGQTVKRIIQSHGVQVYEDSYSCYNGVRPQCGKCPACMERQQAFRENGVEDPADKE